MKHQQIEKYGMYSKMLVFFSNPLYSVIWTSFKRLTDEITKFGSLIKVLEKYMQQHKIELHGYTVSKHGAFVALVKLVVKKSEKAYVWAVDNNNDHLVELFDVTKWDLLNGIEDVNFARIKNIREALSANIASMESVELKASDVAEIDLAMAAYENTIGTTGAAESHKTQGTQGIEEAMDPIDTSLGLIDKLLNSAYENSHPDMVKEYWINRKIEKMPSRHSGVSATITDVVSGKPLQGAILAVNGKTATSDIDGLAEIISIRPGTYMASVSHTNYITQEIRIVIKRGKITELEVKLSK